MKKMKKTRELYLIAYRHRHRHRHRHNRIETQAASCHTSPYSQCSPEHVLPLHPLHPHSHTHTHAHIPMLQRRQKIRVSPSSLLPAVMNGTQG
ncbi:uncharacterized protein BO95DRAFT_278438 [Aspergillus brunneoviolaceus CBS 621.78]|uniref:Uncharacterized protein n=1 Tax=Aspergillus brunneoviolaceus CBS 621.78 TaxID=1450534 RepID=A0ACD1FVN2_9EURO|nr:hypothetical protein BO95DRAFT_278438 [Aspergillus brunneoviolaceus CBS 621.78]RAH41034.1 hypothetical protein BO95DRAFT_278438 [Aspergillus brunneoviolaceus CBS 621.78]